MYETGLLIFVIVYKKSSIELLICVFVVLDNEVSNILLVRKIVYTAITRAKKKCYILSVDGCVNTAITNDHYKERLTKLSDFIKEESGDKVNEYSLN